MRIMPPPLNIGEREGFTEANDIFGRSSFGQGLTSLVQNIDDPLVILLDAPWGAGKSTFLKMWAGDLRNAGHPVIYFDAFAHDHIDNAFLAIAGEVVGVAQSQKDIDKTKVDKFLNVAAKAGGIVLRSAAQIGVRLATLGAINATELSDDVAEVAKEVAGDAANEVDDIVKGLLAKQAEEKATLEQFRISLRELATSLRGSDSSEKSPDRPLVFIVDELDRCRPPFALDLLESIKHLFSVENIHFVLSANHEQLEASVRYSYGSEIRASDYLQKFYTLAVSFPEPDEDHRKVRRRYIAHLVSGHARMLAKDRQGELAKKMLEEVADARRLSLREIEKILSIMNFSFAMTPDNHMKLAPIICGLCVMKVCEPRSYRRAKDGTLTMDDVENSIRFSRWAKRNGDSAEWSKKWWVLSVERPLPSGTNWDEMLGGLYRFNIHNANDILPVMLDVVERLSLPGPD